MVTNLYTYEGVAQILRTEEKKGRLQGNTYSAGSGMLEMSKDMKETRAAIKLAKGIRKGDLQAKLVQLQEKYREALEEEHVRIAQEITSRTFRPDLAIRVFNKYTYVAEDTNTLVVSKIIAKELQQNYGLKPQNRDVIIEQLCGLLDGAMPKVILRADVCDFYESIPQNALLQRIETDGKLSSYSIKYLRYFFHAYNELRSENEDKTLGVPRGLAFSAYLSELYMQEIDDKISSMQGVYFYKRYVDDMVIVANPVKGASQDYWNQLIHILKDSKLTIHNDSDKAYAALWKKDTEVEEFTYLGYTFFYNRGQLEVLLSQKRHEKYRILINAIFEIYNECALGQAWKYDRRRTDALDQLMGRLQVLTGNGLLHGHKCFVATGVYYTNKFLTNIEQLEELDDYLHEVIETRFNPPACLYDYKKIGDNSANVLRIKEKLKSFSFVKSFRSPKLITTQSYEKELCQLKRIYENRKKWLI